MKLFVQIAVAAGALCLIALIQPRPAKNEA